MTLPKKIDSKYIKDAIVEVKYSSEVPFEVMIGFIFNSLDDTFKYTNRNILPNPLENNFNEFKFELKQYLFYNDKIKIQLQPNSIIFNCLNEYILWGDYLPQIENALNQIIKTEKIEFFSRVGIRYISEFTNLDFSENIKFNFSFNQPDIKSNSYSFKSEFDYKNCRAILNLHNCLKLSPIIKGDHKTNTISQIDIDIIKNNIQIFPLELDKLIKIIDDLHYSEKELFFGLLEKDFLKTLNPEY